MVAMFIPWILSLVQWHVPSTNATALPPLTHTLPELTPLPTHTPRDTVTFNKIGETSFRMSAIALKVVVDVNRTLRLINDMISGQDALIRRILHGGYDDALRYNVQARKDRFVHRLRRRQAELVQLRIRCQFLIHHMQSISCTDTSRSNFLTK